MRIGFYEKKVRMKYYVCKLIGTNHEGVVFQVGGWAAGSLGKSRAVVSLHAFEGLVEELAEVVQFVFDGLVGLIDGISEPISEVLEPVVAEEVVVPWVGHFVAVEPWGHFTTEAFVTVDPWERFVAGRPWVGFVAVEPWVHFVSVSTVVEVVSVWHHWVSTFERAVKVAVERTVE